MTLNLSQLRRYCPNISLLLLMLFSASLLAKSLAPCEMSFTESTTTTEHHHASTGADRPKNEHDCCDTATTDNSHSTQAECSMNMLQSGELLQHLPSSIPTHSWVNIAQTPELTSAKRAANSRSILRPPIA